MTKVTFLVIFAIVTLVTDVTGNTVEITPGKYLQWRVSLPFKPGDTVPLCSESCNTKCGPEHKGVSICSSFLESVDPMPAEITNNTQVKKPPQFMVCHDLQFLGPQIFLFKLV